MDIELFIKLKHSDPIDDPEYFIRSLPTECIEAFYDGRGFTFDEKISNAIDFLTSPHISEPEVKRRIMISHLIDYYEKHNNENV